VGDNSVVASDKGEGTVHGTGGWMLMPHFARQTTREGFEIDDTIRTVFERFEIVWPFDVVDMTIWPKIDERGR
jgi:hypothetical protein